ncbi:hypothetical protein [Mycolicibacterium conceptionense]|uniref:hypothetical protein n=1 Tax=Mycolicibacterium conceptionense TaxID=451644 RepID=UPI0006629042|nr:hypothetical protein [Mycolicibacterium conceptionense]
MSELTDRILEILDEELVLDPSHHDRETAQNTWSVGATPDERANAEVEVAGALRECARRVGQRFPGVSGVFYCWYDYQNGGLYVSVTTRDVGDLPFGSRVELVDVEQVAAAFCEQRTAWPGFTAVWAAHL